ncbi:MAG: class I SAM-dependent methyltransferase [Alphaproteobacteria bacterium]
MKPQAHWQDVYSSKDETSLSWFQKRPDTSLRLISDCVQPGANIIDAGGGASCLADHLVELGHRVTVLDIAQAALAKAKTRLGSRASKLNWVVADVTDWRPEKRFDLWHDRAVFHFLSHEQERQAYASVMAAAVKSGGYAVIGTFALNGPETCSGLKVCRYDAKGLAAEFNRDFVLTDDLVEEHLTPGGKVQIFQFSVLRRL